MDCDFYFCCWKLELWNSWGGESGNKLFPDFQLFCFYCFLSFVILFCFAFFNILLLLCLRLYDLLLFLFFLIFPPSFLRFFLPPSFPPSLSLFLSYFFLPLLICTCLWILHFLISGSKKRNGRSWGNLADSVKLIYPEKEICNKAGEKCWNSGCLHLWSEPAMSTDGNTLGSLSSVFNVQCEQVAAWTCLPQAGHRGWLAIVEQWNWLQLTGHEKVTNRCQNFKK